MAPTKASTTGKRSKPARRQQQDKLQQSESSMEASQELDAVSIQRILEHGKSAHDKWRKDREALIRRSRRDRIVKFQQTIKVTYDAHERKLRALRRPKIERLLALVARKKELEECIATTKQDIKQQVLGVVAQVEVVLGRRGKRFGSSR